MKFNGSDYIPQIDDERLSDQHGRVKQIMIDHEWRTLAEISELTGDPEASISAQLRHLRKKRFGSFVVEKRPRGDRKNGLFEYRVSSPGTVSEYEMVERKSPLREALLAVWNHPDCTPAIKDAIRKVYQK